MIPDAFKEQLAKRFELVMDASPDCLLVNDYESLQHLYVNETVCRMAGYSREECYAMTFADLTGQSPGDIRDIFRLAKESGEKGFTQAPHMTLSKDGTRKGWWEAHHRCMELGGRWITITVSRDVSRRVLAERSLERAKRIYAALSDANEAIFRSGTPEDLYQRVCDAAIASGGMTTASVLVPAKDSDLLEVAAFSGVGKEQMFAAVVSTNPDHPEGQGLNGTAFRSGTVSVTDDFLGDSRTTAWHSLIRPTLMKSAASVPIVRNGRTICLLYLSARERRAFDEEILGLLTRMSKNIAYALQAFEHENERQRAEARAKYLASHDSLTGLPNRSLFGELLEQAIQGARRTRGGVGVMFVDLDNFKEINDTHGHAAGDAVLETLAQRLKSTLRGSDVLARLGGDEFVLLVHELATTENAARVAGKLLESAQAPVTVFGVQCQVSASIGVSLFPHHGLDQRALMRAADTAMYRAKEQGKNTWALFDPEL
ncbi:diguanylate cyclase [uncultured Marinobacter sp.]|uniref:diguanylate cyclase domain-containing protein n=1 Tax=uncultured Marinobacter sp. TaxID=187379 RepID=UPI0030DCE4D0